MLMLGRKVGESVLLIVEGEVVGKVTISSIRAGTVRLGFEASHELVIARTEVAKVNGQIECRN